MSELLMPNEIRIFINTPSDQDAQYKQFLEMIMQHQKELQDRHVVVFPNFGGADTVFSIDVHNNSGQKVLMLHDINDNPISAIMATLNGMKGGAQDPYYKKYLKYKSKYVKLMNNKLNS